MKYYKKNSVEANVRDLRLGLVWTLSVIGYMYAQSLTKHDTLEVLLMLDIVLIPVAQIINIFMDKD